MILVPEPAIRSCDLGQWIPCFNSCQMTKEQGPREKNERGYACLSLRKIRNLWWPAKRLYENNEHFTEGCL